MPLVSKAQARWAYWAREHAGGREAKAAREFIAASPHGKGAYKHLPARKKPAKKPKRTFGTLAV
jgi:hypothetical protein